MAYGKREEVRAAEITLKEAGFAVSQVCSSRPSCFDFAARKSHDLVFIKVQPDVDSLSPQDSEDLGIITESVSAASLLISKKTREKPLEDDTVYSRYHVFAVTQKTFENIVVHRVSPLIQAGPGGYYVEIDSEAVKRRRQELGLSVGELAKMVGISRRSLYGYEKDMGKSSVTAAYNLIYALGVPVAKPVNVFQKTKRHNAYCLLATAKTMLTKSKLINRLFSKFRNRNLAAVKRAPFDFIIFSREDLRIVGGIAGSNEPKLDRRIEEILSVSKLVDAHPILITDEVKLTDKDIPCLRSDDVSRLKNPEELILNAT
jgi:putative transcriptional regulator